MEKLVRYIIRPSFSQERMTYLPEEFKVIYESKDGKKDKVFEALEWLAVMGSHVPDNGEQMMCIMDIILMFLGGNARNKTRMNRYLASWSRNGHPRGTERIGRG